MDGENQMDGASGGTEVPLALPKVTSVAAQGLAVGAATVTVAVLVAWTLVKLVDPQPRYCYSDNPCLPDIRPVVLAILALLAVVAGLGPLLAWLLRLPSPWLFALPAMWVLCSSLWPPLVLYPVGSAVLLAIVLATYPVLAVLGLLEKEHLDE